MCCQRRGLKLVSQALVKNGPDVAGKANLHLREGSETRTPLSTDEAGKPEQPDLYLQQQATFYALPSKLEES